MALNLGSIFYQLGVDTSGLNKASNKVSSFQKSTNTSFESVDRAASKLKQTLGALISVEALRRSALLADNYGLLKDRVNAVVGDTYKAAAAFKRLEAISGKTGASLEVTAGGFQKLLFAKETVHGTDEEMIRLTQSFAELGMISGTSTEALNSSMLQFSQGLISGTFQAQEFQSVLEGVPAITSEIAAGMGITVQQLIAMKKEGMLLSEDVFRALVARADEISEKAAQMPVRLNRGFARFQLGIQQALSGIDETNTLTLRLGKSFFEAGEKLQVLPQYVQAIINTMTVLSDKNKAIVRLVGTFLLLQGAIIAVNGAIAVMSGLFSFLVTKTNIFIALAAGVIVFKDQLLAASEAAQGLITAVGKLFELDFRGAKDELLGIVDVYEKTLADLQSGGGETEGPSMTGFLDKFLATFDISNLDTVKTFYAELAKIQEEYNTSSIALQDAHVQTYMESLKKKTYMEVSMEKWRNDIVKSFKTNASYEETKIAEKSFRAQLEGAAQYSKSFGAIVKGLALFDLLVKAPQAIGAAFTYGTAISGGNPAVGAAFAGVAGAAMGVQIAAVTSASYTPRAIGGDVFPGQTYKVNENGPEMFSFGGSDFLSTGSARGKITPNGDTGMSSGGGGSQGVTVNVFPVEGQTASVSESRDSEGGLQLDIIMEQLDASIAEGVRRGTSQASQAIGSVFGLNRAAGAAF